MTADDTSAANPFPPRDPALATGLSLGLPEPATPGAAAQPAGAAPDWAKASAPGLEAIEALARAAVAALPAEFAGPAAQVVLRVEDWPDGDLLDELQIDDPFELTGVYDGVPLTQKSAADPEPFPDRVTLFRRPILDEWTDRGDVTLGQLVRHVVVHEFAHHFGWSDEDIARIDRWWE